MPGLAASSWKMANGNLLQARTANGAGSPEAKWLSGDGRKRGSNHQKKKLQKGNFPWSEICTFPHLITKYVKQNHLMLGVIFPAWVFLCCQKANTNQHHHTHTHTHTASNTLTRMRNTCLHANYIKQQRQTNANYMLHTLRPATLTSYIELPK